MKKLKNNKGITGVDITASIVIIIIAVGIISSMYSKYIENSKQIKRNTDANNLAMDFIEYIEKEDYNILKEDILNSDKATDSNNNGKKDTIEINADDNLGETSTINTIPIPSGYKVTLKNQDEDEIDGIAMKINVEVSYKIGSKEEKISLETIKTTLVNQVNPPDMESSEVFNINKSIGGEEYTRYILKYSNLKEGYIQGTVSDDDWYSISGKRYPVVAYATEKDFDVNGVINLENCKEIYVWVPRFGTISTGDYAFAYDTTNNMIRYGQTKYNIDDYTDNTGYQLIGYDTRLFDKEDLEDFLDDPKDVMVLTDFGNEIGEWVRVNSDLNPIDNLGNEIIDEDNILNILKTQTFIWE